MCSAEGCRAGSSRRSVRIGDWPTPSTPRTPNSATRARSTIYAATTPARVDAVLDLVDAEIDQLLTDGITANELDVAVGYLEGSLVLGLEDSGSRMSRLGGSLTVRGHVRTLDEQLERYRAVTRDDVHRVAEQVLASPRSLAVVGPLPSGALSDRLARTA